MRGVFDYLVKGVRRIGNSVHGLLALERDGSGLEAQFEHRLGQDLRGPGQLVGQCGSTMLRREAPSRGLALIQ